MTNYQQEMEQARQQVAKTGFGGAAVIDVHLRDGFLRLKIKVNPPEKLADFMTNFINIMVMILTMMNIQAKVNITVDK